MIPVLIKESIWNVKLKQREALMAVSFSLVTVLYSSLFGAPAQQSPTVYIDTGWVQGQVYKSREGRNYFQFLGLPYAQPPVGSLRFEVKKTN